MIVDSCDKSTENMAGIIHFFIKYHQAPSSSSLFIIELSIKGSVMQHWDSGKNIEQR